MAPTYLDTIMASHRRRAASDTRDWRKRVEQTRNEGPSFVRSLGPRAPARLAVIAEVKRRSPSRGWLAKDLDAVALARSYEAVGAAAVSVLTDEEFFAGSLEDLRSIRRAIGSPILRKDFTVSENDVLDAVEAGANAVLLIVAALSDTELTSFIALAHECRADALVEVHDVREARRALDSGARIIGVNQRNLHTFEVDRDLGESVIGAVPKDCPVVCESGLASVADVERAARQGFDAVLVGEAFVTAADPAETLRSFSLVVRGSRE